MMATKRETDIFSYVEQLFAECETQEERDALLRDILALASTRKDRIDATELGDGTFQPGNQTRN